MAEEQLDYGDEEFGGSQKMRYHGDGAIPALADDEIGGEDDEFDDLYNDVNVGEGSLQMQRSEAILSANVGNGGFHGQKVNVPVSQEVNIPGVASENVYPTTGLDNKEEMTIDLMQKRMAPQVTNDMGFHGAQKPTIEPVSIPGAGITNEPTPIPSSNPGHGIGGGPHQMPGNQMGGMRGNATLNQVQPPVENGATTLFVGELHWWTTDAELENVLSQYGRVKEIKFFDEKASGKSKGYCQVEFYESGSAAACKDGMNGYVFNGRPCVVAFASPHTIRQMGASYANKNQGPAQSQAEPPGTRPMNDGAGRGGGNNFAGGDAGRNYGRGNWGRGGGQGVMNRGGGHMRGRGAMGPKNVNTPGFGSGPAGGGYGQGLGGPAFGGPPGGFMHPQGMMGGGFDPTYMGRGAGYGGFPGSGFPGMMPQFPGVNTMGLAGVAPHVNPAFFGRGMGGGMGMMGTGGMEGSQAGMWGDTSMGGGGWGGGEDHGQRIRESSYGGEDGGSEYGYGGGEASHDKGTRSNTAVSRDKEYKDEKNYKYKEGKEYKDEKDYKYKEGKEYKDEKDNKYKEEKYKDYKHIEEKDNYRDHRHKDRSMGYEDDWDRGRSSTRSRSRSRAMPEEDHHHHSRSSDSDYGKRRRMRSD